MSLSKFQYWNKVYKNKNFDKVSWYQNKPTISLSFIESISRNTSASIIDVGGGTSNLVDNLIDRSYKDITILDISEESLNITKNRLGEKSKNVNFIVNDVSEVNKIGKFDIWHDRAVFHFLTKDDEKLKYVKNVINNLNKDGHVIIGTFSHDGPEKCSGLPVCRYNSEELKNMFGSSFNLVKNELHEHITPDGKKQLFTFVILKYLNV